jgi:hypothetical protein
MIGINTEFRIAADLERQREQDAWTAWALWFAGILMDDLLLRLAQEADVLNRQGFDGADLLSDAITEITALRARVEELQAAIDAAKEAKGS